jgi:hypothetical protein
MSITRAMYTSGVGRRSGLKPLGERIPETKSTGGTHGIASETMFQVCPNARYHADNKMLDQSSWP